jgi:osmotically-inducible protein OsmY
MFPVNLPKLEPRNAPTARTARTEPTLNVGELAEVRLRNNTYLALKNVSCEYEGGRLTLRGCLPSYYLKQVAQELVLGVAGVREIVNNIKVIKVGEPGWHRN